MLPFNVRAAAVAALFYETKMPPFRSALVEPVAQVRFCMLQFEH